MSVTVTWDDEPQRILRVDYAGRWTFDDVSAAFVELAGFQSRVDGVCSCLHVYGGAYIAPRFRDGLARVESLIQGMAVGLVVVVGNRLLFELYQAMRGSCGAQAQPEIAWAPTVERARRLVAEMRAGMAEPDLLGLPIYAN
jgi:hypothetical protein